MNLFRPKSFLQVGGGFILLVGILGLFGVLGPTQDKSVFDSSFWLDSSEITALIVGGLAALIASFLFPPVWQRYLAILIGIVSLLVSLYSFVNPLLLGAHFEIPFSLAFYLIIAAWALYASFAAGLKRR